MPSARTMAGFLRGLNVGGHRVQMSGLRAILADLGLGDPRTLLASGNVVFDAHDGGIGALEERIEAGLLDALGYEVATFVRTATDMETIAVDPFPEVSLAEGDRIHVLFLKQAAPPGALAKMRELIPSGDELRTGPSEVFWLRRGPLLEAELSDPSKLAKAGVGPVTMRTMNTIRRLSRKFFPG